MLPGGDGAIPQQPVDELFSHNAVGVGPQPVSVVLELHPCVVVADLLPQVLQLRRVLQNKNSSMLKSQGWYSVKKDTCKTL